MKEGWEYKKLDEVCYVEYGTRVVQKKDGGTIYPVYGGGGETFRMDRFNRSDSIVIARFAMSKQCTRFVKGKFFLNDSGLTIRSKVDKIAQDFLNWHIIALNDEIYLLGKGMAQKNLDMPSFRNITLKIPPLSEQQHIVEELDLLSSIIEKKKAQLKELDKLAQSLFYEMFGDPVTNEKKWQLFTMADLCSHIVDCPHSTPKKVDYITQFPCIRTSELKGGTVQWETMQYLDENEYNIRISRLKPIAGDIVFGREGTIGDAVILPDGYSFCLGQRTMLLRVNRTKVSNVYLHRVILSEWVRRQIDAVNVSSTVAHVNIKDFKLFIIPLPPLDLQNQFAEKVQNIEHQKELIKQSIKEVETLFNSRMDYYFN